MQGDHGEFLSGVESKTGPPPRVRGNGLIETPDLGTSGPPPRVRGPDLGRRRRGRGHRTTPTGAGTTHTGPAPAPRNRDHPRGCGDHSPWVEQNAYSRGPPPRVRGPRPLVDGDRTGLGTTPAGAGTTTSPTPSGHTGRDHPAGAGTTSARRRSTRPAWDHPRGCGDHPETGSTAHGPGGPPPRVRGPRTARQPTGPKSGDHPHCGRSALCEQRHRLMADACSGSEQHGTERRGRNVHGAFVVAGGERVGVAVDDAALEVDEAEPVLRSDQLP
jgi:hypothetical protein